MFTSVKISGFRGIERSEPVRLAPLTVLLGPSGSGKSAVLDALLIGSHTTPARAVGRAVRRRGLKDSARWLVHRAEADAKATIVVSNGTVNRLTTLDFTEHTNELNGQVLRRVALETKDAGTGSARQGHTTDFAYDDTFKATQEEGEPRFAQEVHLVDSFQPYDTVALAKEYDELLRRGRVDAIDALVAKLVPRARGLRIGVDSQSAPLLHVVFEEERGAVPLGVAGDGVKLAARATMDLLAAHGGAVLFEEPDAHLHPAAIWLLAKAMVVAVRGGVQIVLSTHSLDLVDALIAECSDDLTRFAIVQTRLADGELMTSRVDGEAARHERVDLADDLR
jgi:predicted ATPase